MSTTAIAVRKLTGEDQWHCVRVRSDRTEEAIPGGPFSTLLEAEALRLRLMPPGALQRHMTAAKKEAARG